MISVYDYLKENTLICDGAFGTYYAKKFDTKELPELANFNSPIQVEEIHREYVQAGAKLIRTNTFAANTVSLNTDLEQVKKNIVNACFAAQRAAEGNAYVAGDIGPVPADNFTHDAEEKDEYTELCKIFIECGVDAIVFETFSDMGDILPAIRYVKENSSVFVIVQFAVSQYGYSGAGLSARRLFEEAKESPVDAFGLNCGVGPGHMYGIFEQNPVVTDKYITALPNAGYPHNISNRMVYSSDNAGYFAGKVKDIIDIRADIAGGCCGTEPDHIRQLAALTKTGKKPKRTDFRETEIKEGVPQDFAFYSKKRGTGRKLIAVELAPPMGSDDKKLMEAAHLLSLSDVDVLTFPDSPSGRTRVDSVLMAEKVAKETGMCVMPHLCCRDKNAIAIRSQLLGSHINGIHNFLVITGDPVPALARSTVKAVFNFNSVGLMNIIKDMNQEQFEQTPMVYGGAINQNRRNLDVEIDRVRKKMDMGATFFFTQPVFNQAGVDILKKIKEETGARILCGIMPLVSLKNALFMKNEMTGIDVDDDVIRQYESAATKEEGERVGISIAKDVIERTADFVDGYYFTFPFNRVHMLDEILK
jgi:homocysteine S-methyltransferase